MGNTGYRAGICRGSLRILKRHEAVVFILLSGCRRAKLESYPLTAPYYTEVIPIPTPSIKIPGGNEVARYSGRCIVQCIEAVLAVMDYFSNVITRQEGRYVW